MGAIGRLGEGSALDLGILRIVVGMDDVDHAVPQPVDNRLAIGLRTQRRVELEKGPVRADVGPR